MSELKNKILGTWKLVSYYRLDEDGEKVYPLGTDPSGFFFYF